jgi:hypothetical protein
MAKSNQTTNILIALGVIILLGIVVFMLMRNKDDKNDKNDDKKIQEVASKIMKVLDTPKEQYFPGMTGMESSGMMGMYYYGVQVQYGGSQWWYTSAELEKSTGESAENVGNALAGAVGSGAVVTDGKGNYASAEKLRPDLDHASSKACNCASCYGWKEGKTLTLSDIFSPEQAKDKGVVAWWNALKGGGGVTKSADGKTTTSVTCNAFKTAWEAGQPVGMTGVNYTNVTWCCSPDGSKHSYPADCESKKGKICTTKAPAPPAPKPKPPTVCVPGAGAYKAAATGHNADSQKAHAAAKNAEESKKETCCAFDSSNKSYQHYCKVNYKNKDTCNAVKGAKGGDVYSYDASGKATKIGDSPKCKWHDASSSARSGDCTTWG